MGGQSIPAFDYYMAPGVAKTMITELVKVIDTRYDDIDIDALKSELKGVQKEHKLILNDGVKEKIKDICAKYISKLSSNAFNKLWDKALKYTDKATHQAMEALIHNLNSMHSRAGSQVPFSSINYGTDISEEGRMVIRNVLLATWEGLGNGETPIFPIQIFKLKSGVSYNPEDPNYDLFKYACKVSAKRLFPNFSNLDAPYNAVFLKEGDYNTEIAYMGCRTRTISNAYDPDNQVVTGRGNLSFTSINLPRLAIRAGNGNIDYFFELLDEKMALVKRQLLKRLKLQMEKHVYNYPFLMGQGVWLESEKLNYMDRVGDILKHGSLSIGFIGLAETLIALTGKHHGESADSQALGLKIIGHMRELTDKWSQEEKLNWGIIGTPAEGLSSRFTLIDKRKYGEIEGITDKDYYTNSFHIPVYYNISAYDKLKLEAPYHELTNAGHISYIEMDGDPLKNLDAFEDIVRAMHDLGIGYGAINHPVDRDPVCGYTGIINDVCPRCGRKEGEGITLEKLEEIEKRYGLIHQIR